MTKRTAIYKKKRYWWLASKLLLIFLLIGSYFFLTSKPVLEKILRWQFSLFTTGSIELNIEKFSLFTGFDIKDIVIRSGKDFDEQVLLSVKHLKLHYYLPGFWVGDIGIHELGIYSPRLFLRNHKGKWNIATLFRPSKSKPKKKKSSGFPQSIKTYYDIRVFLYAILDDLAVEVESPNMKAHVKNFGLKASLLTKEFHTLPVNLSVLSLLDTLMLQMNAQNKVDVHFSNAHVAVEKKIDLRLLLHFLEQKENFEFASKAQIGEKNISFRYNQKNNMPFDFLFSYNINYLPQTDNIQIDHIALSFLQDTWFSLKGSIQNITKKATDFSVDVSMQKSKIHLDKLHPYFRYFTNNQSLLFGGDVSLMPLHLKGVWDNLNLTGKILLSNIFLQEKSLHVKAPFWQFMYKSGINLNLSQQKPLPYLKNFHLTSTAKVNNANFNLQADYIPQKKTFVSLNLKKIEPQQFASYLEKDVLKQPVAFRGLFDLLVQIKGKKETNLSSLVKLSSPEFAYRLNLGFSPINKLKFMLLSDITASDYSFSNMQVRNKSILLSLSNGKNEKALKLEGNGKMEKTPKKISYRFNLNELFAHLTRLKGTLPNEYQEKITAVTKKVPNQVTLKGNSFVLLQNEKTILENNYFIVSPDLQITDVQIENKIILTKKTIDIKKLQVTGLNKSLSVGVSGTLQKTLVSKLDKNQKIIKTQGYRPELSSHFFFGKKERTEVYPGYFIDGDINLLSKISGNMVKGKLSVNNFNFDKDKLKIKNINFNFPFEHNLLLRKTLSLTYGNKERIIKNYNFSRPYNLTVESIDIPHPIVKGKILNLVYPVEQQSGVSATTYYEDNVFHIPVMEIYTLNGLVSLKDIFFNVGRGKLSEMEYLLQAQVKNTDLKQLIPPDKAKAIKDGAIYMDVTFVGEGIETNPAKMVEEINGKVSVYKIGKEFGKQALKVVKPDSIAFIDLAVDQSIIVNKLDMDFKEGLVYARVLYRKGALGMLIGPAGNQLLQERIPLPEYLQRAKQEVEAYKLDTSTAGQKEKEGGIF